MVTVVVVVMAVVVAFCAHEVDAIASLANRWKPEKVYQKTKSKSLCQVSLVYLVSILSKNWGKCYGIFSICKNIVKADALSGRDGKYILIKDYVEREYND